MGNLPEDGDQDHTIKVIRGKLTVTNRRSDKIDVCVTGGISFGLGSGKHSQLNIDRNNTTN
ncbi:hypothetical protein Thiosp_03334 [Thiorhodovibrio litoralis]|nr:hypothetical protein Thiosp_03334 [Thiorhodovibrio litoralis]